MHELPVSLANPVSPANPTNPIEPVSVWTTMRGWGPAEWELFLRRAVLDPRTYCLAYTIGVSVLVCLRVPNLSAEGTRCMLTLYSVAALSV